MIGNLHFNKSESVPNFVAEVSVDEQRHYAEDAGKTQEEVLQITQPKRTLSFESSGVLVPKSQSTH